MRKQKITSGIKKYKNLREVPGTTNLYLHIFTYILSKLLLMKMRFLNPHPSPLEMSYWNQNDEYDFVSKGQVGFLETSISAVSYL